MRDIKKNSIENIQQTQQKPRPLDLARIKSGKQTQDVIQKLKPTREQIGTEIARRGYKTSGEIKLGVNRNLWGGMDAGSSSSSSWTSYLSPSEKQDFESQCQQYKSLKEEYIRYIKEEDNKNSKDMYSYINNTRDMKRQWTITKPPPTKEQRNKDGWRTVWLKMPRNVNAD